VRAEPGKSTMYHLYLQLEGQPKQLSQEEDSLKFEENILFQKRMILIIRLAIQLIEQDIKKLSTVNQFICSVTRFVAANDWA